MRHYQIYLLQEKVASHFFGQEPKLFQLFSDRKNASIADRFIFDKQIEFISKPLPTLLLQQKVKLSLKGYSSYSELNLKHQIKIHKPNSFAELLIHGHYLSLMAEGGPEAETIFFEILRKVDPCFFAVDVEHDHYGWLNPIRQVKYFSSSYWN
ncbi:sporulation inhibitor of replication protein SirA [Alkalihalobacillus sp. 1P02AB]|uniref:sporulation inhibitor of replication protein SirA n=1 Tax=Alkalihalobacillus sp. 1P02AB TaxID=3132260 RepID=UPI0039A67636